MPEWLLPRDTHPIPSPIPSPTERTPNKPDLVVLWENGMVLKYQNSHLHSEEDDYQTCLQNPDHRVAEETKDT